MPTQKIESLTPEQEALMPVFVDKWLKVATSTDRIDFKSAAKAVQDLYKVVKLTPPTLENIFYVKGPDEGYRLFKKLGGADVNTFIQGMCYGNMEAGWLSFYDYAHHVLKVELTHLPALVNLAESTGWVYMAEDAAIVLDRPTTFKFDEQNRPHSEQGPALAFADGTAVSAWHGVIVPNEWLADKTFLTAKMALTEPNMERRRAACEILGWINILETLNYRLINKDEDPQIGTLVEVDIPDIGTERFIIVQCGTGRQFAIPVPPDMKTALQANAWTYGLEDFEYKPEVRT